MSFPDYSQKAEDHQSILILVKLVGAELKPKSFGRVYDRISRVECVHVPNQQRTVWMRYKSQYPIENNEWGDFQAHRKVLGLLCIGKARTTEEMEDIYQTYEDEKTAYSSTMYDSRLVVFGMNTDGSPSMQQSDPSDPTLLTSVGGEGSDKQGSTSTNTVAAETKDANSESDKENAHTPDGDLEIKSGELETKNGDLVTKAGELEIKDGDLKTKNGDIQIKDPLRYEPEETTAISKIDSVSEKLVKSDINSSEKTEEKKSGTVPGGQLAVKKGQPNSDSPLQQKKQGHLSPSGQSTPASGSPSGSRRSSSRGKDPKSHIWFYADIDKCPDLEEKVKEFVMTLFWVLEGKRLDRSFEKKMQLISAPFEKKDMVGVDVENKPIPQRAESKKKLFFLERAVSTDKSDLVAHMVDTQKVYRKRCQGRLRKHLGDLCLLAGVPGEAILHYSTALDILKSANDWLWLAAAYEGLCSASVIIMYPREERQSFQRNYSWSTKRGSSMMQEAKQRSSAQQNRNQNGLDLARVRIKNCLMGDDIIEKYKEAIMHYSKFKNVGIVEMEASIKACRVLIMQGKNLQASEFLQNVVYINLQMSEEEKVLRYSTLATLYEQINFHRKAAFFKRVAAMQSVAPTVPNPSWERCHQLLMQSLKGYSITLDYRERVQGEAVGWPIVQSRVLHEVVYCARKLGNVPLIIRHMTHLLHMMHHYLTPQEKRELSNLLETYTCHHEGLNQPIALDSGQILPAAPLLNLPQVRVMKLMNLPLHLRPVAIKSTLTPDREQSPSPFIYSPLQFSAPMGRVRKDRSKMDFQWVMDDVCEVALQVFNPMPYELKVSNVALLTDGVDFVSHPSSMSLQANSGPYVVKVLGTPKGAGQLNITGYTTTVLGVRNNCKLRDIPRIREAQYTVEVIPPLPQLQVTTSVPRSRSYSNLDEILKKESAILTVFAGESFECQVMLTNTGSYPIEVVELALDSKGKDKEMDEVFVWNMESLQSQLPIAPGSHACFTIFIHGVSNFISKESTVIDDKSAQLSPARRPRSTGLSDLSTVALKSSQSWNDLVLVDHSAKIIQATFKFKYSGGPGLERGFCRHCVVPMNIAIQPAVVMKAWDVVARDTCDTCKLVLDVQNTTDHWAELTTGDLAMSSDDPALTSGKTPVTPGDLLMTFGDPPVTSVTPGAVTLAEKKTKRIWIPIRRCKIQELYDIPLENDNEDVESSEPVHRRHRDSLSHHLHDNAEGSEVAEKIQEECLKYLSEFVDIRWSIPHLQKSGKIAVDKLPWSDAQLELVRETPIHWDISLNKRGYSGEAHQFNTGELVQLDVSLTCRSDFPIPECTLSVQCHRKYNPDLSCDRHVTITGQSCKNTPELGSGSTFRHTCHLTFYHTGQYVLDITCTELTSNVQENACTWTCSPEVSIDITDSESVLLFDSSGHVK
ncbi:trafficking protein particle complex subunit 9 [Lingula anatina]|uniref:Trafficking protein particle complex subunit 9 n=1 Tax=Lingula anatina TaxID=7574 RepID=A0A1S3HZR3_LINAN|nr:trafficking protein particle complex subunit 9 [Lingula anatina]|eukprot:XP_013391061.1 trafficking protein particle complex subunit 9 [Lingula anatina]